MAAEVFVGIDGGGTSTLVRAVVDGVVTFDGRSGPANATTTPVDLVAQHVEEAAAGCPAPVRVAGCFAGLSNAPARRMVARVLGDRFPVAELRLAPDYLAVALASPVADVVVIAGTGSVCVSFVDGTLVSTGGLGYLLGDRGSGFRYGQLLVEHCLLLPPDQVPEAARTALVDVFGTADRSEVVQQIHTAGTPAELLARFASTLGAAADADQRWALDLVDREARSLAALVAAHLRAHVGADPVAVELAGSVWRSRAIRSAFAGHLLERSPGRELAIHSAREAPVDGAVRLAAMPEADFAQLVEQRRAIRGGSHGN